jgi:hypothetical protein
MTLAIALVIFGMVGIIWGFPAAHRLRKPFDILAALTVLAGVATTILGALIITVPDFFKGL